MAGAGLPAGGGSAPAGLTDAAAVAITGGTITGITDLAIADGGTGASTAATARTGLGLDTIYGRAINTGKRCYRSEMAHVGAFTCIEATSYFVYMGYTTEAVTPKYVEAHLTTAGTGTQNCEVGLFSTPLAPNKAGQTLTKLVSDATVDNMVGVGAGMKRNTSALATSVAAGVHLWVGIRTAFTTNEPSFVGLSFDYSHGNVLALAGSNAFAGESTYAGAVIALAASNVCPALTMVLD